MSPTFGEIWDVQFEPQIGSEIKKIRPAIIISTSALDHLPTRLVIPVRDFKEFHRSISYYLSIIPSTKNGLSKISTADPAQLKSFDIKRCLNKRGHMSKKEMMQLSTIIGMITRQG